MEKQLQPKLTFSNSKWEYNKLSKFISNLVSGVSVNSDNKEIINDEKGILKTSSVVNGKFIPTENKRILVQDLERARLNPIKNSLLISRMNTPDLVGNFGFIDKDYPNLFIPDRLWMTVLNDNIIPKFLNYCLLTPKSKFKITSLATGTSNSMKNISKTSFLDIEIATPSLPEQQKIADYLTTIDRKIELLTEKKTELSRYKKAMMQKLFAQEIRFKDENRNDYPEWEEKRLGDLGEIITGKTPSTSDKTNWNGDIQFITPSDLYEGIKYVESTERSVELKKLNVLPIGSIVYTCIASIGKIGLTTKPSITNQQINSLIVKNDSKEYVYYFLLHLTPYIKSTQSNTTLPIINKTEFSKFKIQLPRINEQQKIADFLTSIDDNIAKVEEQIKETQNFKKAMLQQMFV